MRGITWLLLASLWLGGAAAAGRSSDAPAAADLQAQLDALKQQLADLDTRGALVHVVVRADLPSLTAPAAVPCKTTLDLPQTPNPQPNPAAPSPLRKQEPRAPRRRRSCPPAPTCSAPSPSAPTAGRTTPSCWRPCRRTRPSPPRWASLCSRPPGAGGCRPT